MAATSSTLVPVPTSVPVTPNFGNLDIRNDLLYAKDEQPYTGWDLHMRIGIFVLSQAIPVLSTLLLVFSGKGWWQRKYYWSISRLMLLWLVSVQVFAIMVYNNKGATTRTTHLVGAVHLQIEYMILALLLKSSALKALVIAYIAGSILFAIQLFTPDYSILYIATTIAGFPDILIPVLFTYGKQRYFAIGSFAHLVQAGAVFGVAVKNYGHLTFNLLTFSSTIVMNGALVYAVLTSGSQEGSIRLADSEDDEADKSASGEAFDNPLAHVDIPQKTLYTMFGASIAGTTVIAFLFVFVLARD